MATITAPTPAGATIPALIKRHPVLAYYALTFAISWGASSC